MAGELGKPLCDLVDLSRGISYGIVQPGQHTPDGIPIVRVTDIRNGRIDTSSPLRVSPEVADRHRRTTLRGGELLLTLVGTVGETAIVPPDLEGWNTARAVAVIPVLPDPGPRWVQYALQTGAAREYINTHLNTTVQATLNLRDVSSFPIRIPHREERNAILHILGTLDDKIELNRRTNETLEAMARALFKSWFVDFDPVRSKAEGRAPGGMDAATAGLFPSAFQKTDFGEVPRGWDVCPLGEVMQLKRGYDLPAASRNPGDVPIVSSSGTTGWHNEAKVKGPGVVTGRYGTIGQVFLIWEDFWPLNTTLYLQDPKGNDLFYCHQLLSRMDFLKFSDKAAVPGINRNHVHEERIVRAPRPVQERFSSIAGSWLHLARRNHEQMITLAAIRDALLPRLLSGELPIPAAMRIAETA